MLVCLLVLGVPLQGLASVRYMDDSCPMMQGGSMHVMGGMSADDMAGMAHEMEHGDHDGDSGQSGKACSAGASCHSVGALQCRFPAPVFIAVAHPAPPLAGLNFQSHDPPLLWRPPALF
jgi:hypothetical protein